MDRPTFYSRLVWSGYSGGRPSGRSRINYTNRRSPFLARHSSGPRRHGPLSFNKTITVPPPPVLGEKRDRLWEAATRGSTRPSQTSESASQPASQPASHTSSQPSRNARDHKAGFGHLKM
ncbi:hypothetical protein Pcinc_019483 [Petrolisthes cinctipes]|uniref:Uncharacterized protein n=1 Tax=Petrolisthes cinctipes TaxID=88211 RepID=A0AAE1FK03_PETCI|nr:hypothetical protein Pcinc_019483 [Petrolisthes cinctipes]